MTLKINKRICALLGIILVLCLIFTAVLAGQSYNQASAKITYTNATGSNISIGELLYTARTTTTVGTSIFDYDNITKLFSVLSGNGTSGKATIDDVSDTMRNYTKSFSTTKVININYGMDSEDIRKLTGNGNAANGSDIVVTLGGFEWYVTAVTNKGTGGSDNDNIILTLLMKEPLANTVSKWGMWSENNTTYTYPSNMYSTSYMRAKLLNGYDSNGLAIKYTTAAGTTATAQALKTLAEDANAVPLKDSAGNYPFSIFADTKDSKNIMDFLVAPNEVYYQQYENMYDLTVENAGGIHYNMSNESAKEKSNGSWFTSGSSLVLSEFEKKDRYWEWGSDKLWLPSYSEMGVSASQVNGDTNIQGWQGGLWKLDDNQRSFEVVTGFTLESSTTNSTNAGQHSWLRSGGCTNTYGAYALSAAGATGGDYVSANSFAIRPALNLNLSAAAISAAPQLAAPSDTVSVEYTGSKITYDDITNVSDWWTSVKDKVTVEYGQVVNGNFTKVDIIEPSATLASGSKFVAKINIRDDDPDDPDKITQWEDTCDRSEKVVEIVVTKKTLSRLTWDVNEGNGAKTFTGGNLEFMFTINQDIEGDIGDTKFFNDIVEITSATDGVNISYDYWSFIVGKEAGVGDKKITVKLRDTDHYQWSGTTSSSYEMTYTIKKIPVKLNIGSETSTANNWVYNLECSEGSTLNVKIELADGALARDTILSGYDLTFNITATARRTEILTPNGVALTNADNNGKVVTLDTSALTTNAAYNPYTLKIDVPTDSIYDVTLAADTTVKINEVVVTSLRWQLYSNGLPVSDYYEIVELDSTNRIEVTFTPSDKNLEDIVYDGSYYQFMVTSKYPSGYEPASSTAPYSTDFDNIYGQNSNVGIGVCADTYTTTFVLKNDDGDTMTFVINWEIKQATFDLSNAVWKYDGQLPYAGGADVIEEIDLKSLPAGITPVYITGTNVGRAYGATGIAEVDYFQLDSSYVGNYKEPKSKENGDNDTYIGDNSIWSKSWTVVQAIIDTTAWQLTSHTDTNNKTFNIRELVDPLATETVVRYMFYEADASGAIKDSSNALTIDDLVWPTDEAKFYVAKVELLDSAGGYKLSDPNAQSKIFILGESATPLTHITVELKTTDFDYNTQSRYISVNVTSGPRLSNSFFDIEYYDGVTKLSAGPVEAGTYTVVISLKSQYLTTYAIDGNSTFTMKINQTVITPNWNMDTTPPTLYLDYGLINAIDYKIFDLTDSRELSAAEVTNRQLTAGHDFQILAEIKPEYQRSITFDTTSANTSNLYETTLVDFSVTDNSTLVNPYDPTLPSYGQTNPDEVPDDSDPSTPTNPTTPSSPTDITLEWANTNPPTLTAEQTALLKPTYTFKDSDGNTVDKDKLEKGKEYTVTVSFSTDITNKYNIKGETSKKFTYKENIPLEWDTTQNPPVLKIPEELEDVLDPDDIEYEYFDKDGNPLTPEDIANGAEVDSVKVKLPDGFEDEYVFVNKDGEVVDMTQPLDPYADQEEPSLGEKFRNFLQDYWQVIVSGVALVLIIAFTAKGISYASKRSKNKKQIKKLTGGAYAFALYTAGEKLWNIDYKIWTILAFTLLGVAVLSFIFMLLEKHGYKKSQEELQEVKANPSAYAMAGATAGNAATQPYQEESRSSRKRDRDIERLEEELRKRDEEYRRRDEEMRMMFMSMMGGTNGAQNAGGAQQFAGVGSGTNIVIDAEYIKSAITETIAAIMPAMQALLPQQAGSNEEIVKLLAEEIKDSKEENRKIMQNQDKLIAKLLEKDNSSDNAVLEQLAKNQEMLAKQVKDLSERPQEQKVVEKVVEKPVEKIVEKVVEKPVEKIVEKKVEVPVEKIVEVPVEKVVEKVVEKKVEVPVEKIVEKVVEKPVEKIVHVPVEKVVEKIVKVPAEPKVKPAVEKQPRLTIDEAYARLSKEQKKFFDKLREYALSKEKCKEKKSTYNILLGQSSINPLVKLTIKKDTTVALFKMEDEYFKDIRRNAGSDGTKVKVKETEVIVADQQAYDTAKQMIDLREDQIERYSEFLREQRAYKK